MYDQVLHPTDGSAVAGRARDYVIDIAKQYDATLHVLHAVSLDEVDRVPERADRDLLEELQDEGEDVVQATIDEAHRRDVSEVEEELILGRPTETILEYADEHAIDLIVMGTHGRTGLSHYLVGSVAEKSSVTQIALYRLSRRKIASEGTSRDCNTPWCFGVVIRMSS